MPKKHRQASVPVHVRGGGRFLLTPSQIKARSAKGDIYLDNRRWFANPTFGSALKRAKGERRYKAHKKAWNQGNPTGGGMYLTWPRRDDETRRLQAAERMFQNHARDYIDGLTT